MDYLSDLRLRKQVRKFGRFDTDACYQCGSCTVSCELSGDLDTFPRKTIRYVLLGLKEPLLSSLAPWLCHDCGDCSSYCPRETEPREAIRTIRRYLMASYDWTGLSSKILQSRLWLIGSIVLAAVIVMALALAYHLYIAELSISDLTSTAMPMEHMFGIISYFTIVVILVPFFFLISHAFRMWWFTMHEGTVGKIPFTAYISQLKSLIVQTFTQRRMAECPQEVYKRRRIIHWGIAAGCILMFVLLVFFLPWFQTDAIYPVQHPQRWLGYLAALGLLIGSADIIIGRIRKKNDMYAHSEFSDFTFPALLFLTAVSGIAVHIFRYMGLEMATHFSYAIHLAIATPLLVIEMPFGKWSHMIYRPLAIYFQDVKDRASEGVEAMEELKAA